MTSLQVSVEAALLGLGAAFALCVLLVLTQPLHGVFTLDHSHGVQKFHTAPTPRIGGLPIYLGLCVAASMAPTEVQALLKPMLWAGLPAFGFGLAEDLTKRVGVLPRLLATMASGVVAWLLTGHGLESVNVAGLDLLLRWTPFMVVATAFAVGGVANAINIIDGFNGLASMTVMLALAGYGLIAYNVGDTTLAGVSLLLALSVMGFFWVNWPLGKLFLGDGGSYFIGFALAWVAVLLLARNPSVNAFAALLVCIHPVTEVLFSIYRRKLRQMHVGMPDRLHFHSLLKKRYVRRWFKGHPPAIRNSITGLMMSGFTLLAVLLAQLVHRSVQASIVVVVLMVTVYVAVYARMIRHRWCSPISLFKPRPKLLRAQS